MPPTIIPPSPDVNMNSVSRSSEKASEIVAKINQGKEVTSLDIQLLKTELDQFQQANHDDFHTLIPYVDRKFIKSCPSNPQVVCRYVGFVQDVLEPEYYVSLINGGNTHTKYRDLYYHENEVEDEISSMNYIEERQPFLLVPIPASCGWFRRFSDSDSNHPDFLIPSHDVSKPPHDERHLKRDRKRSAEDHQTLINEQDQISKQSRSSSRPLEESSSTTDIQESSDLSTDWWPQGHLGSDPKECPVLAKIYENQDDIKMKLNSLVEVFGILDLDPLGTSFSAEQRNEISRDEDAFFHDFMDPMFTPPPSLLPRLHVLYYKSLDLDEMACRHQKKLNQTLDVSNLNNYDPYDVSSERKYIINTLAKAFGGDMVLAESILMVLLSIAERDPRDPKKIVKLPCESTLGATSLNLILQNSLACQQMSNLLSRLLSELVPIFANVNLTLDELNHVSSTSALVTPAKCDMGRMNTSVLQLPKGACVLINQGGVSGGSVSENGLRVLSSLQNLTKTHSIPYRFQGLYDIDFEADLRCIVLSTGSTTTGSKLLPCALRLKLDDTAYTFPSSLSGTDIIRIRHFISRCRDAEQSSISLSSKLLEKAEEDFVERRQRFKGSDGRSMIEEDDFHRWLTLTRLQARSRLKNIATVEDWESAILLDEKMSR